MIIPVQQCCSRLILFNHGRSVNFHPKRASSSVIVYAITAGAFVDSQSLSQVVRSSLRVAARPRERWKAAIALPHILTGFPVNDTWRYIKPVEEHFRVEGRRSCHLWRGRLRARDLTDCRR